MIRIIQGDNLQFLRSAPDSEFDLIYIDPPFNTGKVMTRKNMKAVPSADGNRGFGDRAYKSESLSETAYNDAYGDGYIDFIKERLIEAYRIMKPNASLFFHIDYREAHYVKILLDTIFGRDNFMNEIIWAYDYGGRSKSRWSCKHDTIFWYAKDAKDYTFDFDEIDRIPYMAPLLVGAEKAERGKTPTDTWWHTIVPTNGKEKTGYATQKPLGIIERIVRVHSKQGDNLLDFFAGSGTFGAAAAKHGRHATLIDENPQAIEIMKNRLAVWNPTFDGV